MFLKKDKNGSETSITTLLTRQSKCIYSKLFVFISMRKYVTVSDELTGYGARTVPSFKRHSSSLHGSRKKTKNELPNYKFLSLFTLKQQDLEDIYDVPADLSKLQKKTMNFTVFNIQEELAFQLGQPDEAFIKTNKKGHPI